MATDGSTHFKELLGIAWFTFLNSYKNQVKRRDQKQYMQGRLNGLLIFPQVYVPYKNVGPTVCRVFHVTVLVLSRQKIHKQTSENGRQELATPLQNMSVGGKNYQSRWYMIYSSRHVQTSAPNFKYTILARVIPQSSVT